MYFSDTVNSAFVIFLYSCSFQLVIVLAQFTVNSLLSGVTQLEHAWSCQTCLLSLLIEIQELDELINHENYVHDITLISTSSL